MMLGGSLAFMGGTLWHPNDGDAHFNMQMSVCMYMYAGEAFVSLCHARLLCSAWLVLDVVQCSALWVLLVD